MSLKTLDSRAIIGEYYARLALNPGSMWINMIAMEFMTNQETETYKWLDQVPQMRRWEHGRQAKNLVDYGVTIKNEIFEATLELNIDEVRRDKTGQGLIRARELADRTNSHWATLMSKLIQDGKDRVCYDSQYYFDTDHTQGRNETNQSNDIRVDIGNIPVTNHGTTTDPSVGEMNQVILAAIQAILGFTDNENEPMNEGAMKFMVMVPVSLWHKAQAAVSMPVIDSQASNVMMSLGMEITVVSNTRLNWTDSIAVFRCDGNVKPFIMQSEEQPIMTMIGPGSELEFNERIHRYGVTAIRNVGYGYWQQSCLATMI